MPAFPTNGELLFDGYGEQPERAVIRTDMEAGPPKQAMIRQRQNIARPVAYRFSSANYAAFKVWFRDQIARGASWFDWTDPLDGVVRQARMQNGEFRAQMVNNGTGAPDWDVFFSLETWDA